ncbi:MAG TPA: hypothetical protein VD966_10180 [Pyrinomonadaceae bacterium]|nr:hypothetical protein [Pyrinomonadaceae bacterium]
MNRKTKQRPAPEAKSQKQASKKVKEKAIARWEGEGGALAPAKEAGVKKDQKK